jgi:hypothetical protein
LKGIGTRSLLYWVIGMLVVPQGHQVGGPLSDVLGVGEGAPERALGVERPQDALVDPDLDLEGAVQVDVGGVDGDAGMDGPPVQQQADGLFRQSRNS